MKDKIRYEKQALEKGSEGLRAFQNAVLSSIPNALSFTSGKGGVGKTNIVANLAISSAMRSRKTLIVDCDLGLSNIDVQMGLNPRFNLMHALQGERSLDEVLVTGPAGVKVLAAPFGVQELTHLSSEQKLNLMALLEHIEASFDLILLDTGAGISSNVMFFNMIANHIVVILTPDPSSMTDAYALIKVMNTQFDEDRFHLLINNVQSDSEGLAYYRKFVGVIHNFLNVSIGYLGCMPRNSMFTKATMTCRPLVELFPNSEPAKRFFEIAARLDQFPEESLPKENLMHWANRREIGGSALGVYERM